MVEEGSEKFAMSSHPMGLSSGETLDNLAPIFPPQNFDVPDISFSNSVSPHTDFNQFSSAHIFAGSSTHNSDAAMPFKGSVNSTQSTLGGQLVTYLPPVSSSPPGTSSSEDSDDLPLAQLAKRAATPGSPTNTDSSAVQKKTNKRKKKKDPNEPQKPVSAYALFFRDTQATIKGHNPNASFGEVSKIVASMWDQLDPDHKDVYKKKTEQAKKQYLKQLAAYRATQVSQQTATDESEGSTSPPAYLATGSPPAHITGPGMSPVHLANNMTGQMMARQEMMSPHGFQQHMQPVVCQSPPRHSPPSPLACPPQDSTSYQTGLMEHSALPDALMDLAYPHCVRSGCTNYAKENPSWDTEYCSNDCVISHCRDIFTTWVSARTGTSSYTVK
ncbi:TOX high mobility group box family member 4-like [Physella acuta]|uniref:TOX high mobility group box family member 4-like n=1 Tax=Physella acuta TaxID=109671 RepID=UPI0027DE7BC0|nr:TOX high mobility group box family member 4-like [Physella acuta]